MSAVTVVLDASAGAEMVVGSTLGRRLLALAPRDRTWWVPDHFHVECAGAVRRMLLRALIDEARASPAIARLLSLPVTVAREQPVIAEAWTHRNNLIVHDAVYIVLAKHLGAPVLTGDVKMAAHPTFPSRSSTSPNASTRPGTDEPPRCGQLSDDVSVVEAEKLSPSVSHATVWRTLHAVDDATLERIKTASGLSVGGGSGPYRSPRLDGPALNRL